MKIENEFRVRDDQGNVLVTVKTTTIWEKAVVLGTLNDCPIPAWELTPHIAAEFNHGDWEKYNHPKRIIVQDEADARAEAQRLAMTVLAFNENMKTLLQRYRDFRQNWEPKPGLPYPQAAGGGGGGGIHHHGISVVMGETEPPLTLAQEQRVSHKIKDALDAHTNRLLQSLKSHKG